MHLDTKEQYELQFFRPDHEEWRTIRVDFTPRAARDSFIEFEHVEAEKRIVKTTTTREVYS